MPPKALSKASEREIKIQKAILALKKNEFASSRAAAAHFGVSRETLRRRAAGGLTHVQAAETQQLLSNAEEKTLVKWITHYTAAGTPLSPSLLVELAELIRQKRVRVASGSDAVAKTIAPIGQEWIYRFLNRHPTVQGLYARQIENARFNGATPEIVQNWFDAFAASSRDHSYEPRDVWNMDESGFAVGDSQTTRVIVPCDVNQKNKVVAGKQEWVTDVECISAAGSALPPFIIFKGKNMNSGWLPAETPADWHFGVSDNGWTSNNLCLRWLVNVFEPLTRREGVGHRRLLIADGHGSHIRADFIAHCMENAIDLLIMPPHCSHILQPLDVGVFAAFKRAHAIETDKVARLSSQRLSRLEWLQIFIQARKKAVRPENILGGWRGAGLIPFDPRRVISKLPTQSTESASRPQPPPQQGGLALSLLADLPPDGTELREANAVLRSAIAQVEELLSPSKRYIERVTRLAEAQNAELAILRKQLQDQQELLKARSNRTKGKRVNLRGEFLYTTSKVLEVARAAEAKPVAKRPRGRPRKRPIEEIEDEEEAQQ